MEDWRLDCWTAGGLEAGWMPGFVMLPADLEIWNCERVKSVNDNYAATDWDAGGSGSGAATDWDAGGFGSGAATDYDVGVDAGDSNPPGDVVESAAPSTTNCSRAAAALLDGHGAATAKTPVAAGEDFETATVDSHGSEADAVE
nr:hypothetical protein Iba_chr02bCG12050 [Ipomoea batatas]